jgi:predicted aconitase with swiveling domain
MLVPGACTGKALVLDTPLSFWGGVDPESGRIIDRQHPQCGVRISNTVLVLPGVRGSTAAPGALLELMVSGAGPAALLSMDFEIVPLVSALTVTLLERAPPPVAVMTGRDGAMGLRTGVTVTVDPSGWFIGDV